MPKRKTKKRVQVTCTRAPGCGVTRLCSFHKTELEAQINGIFVITSTFTNRQGDNFQGTIRVEGFTPAKWFVQAIRKNKGYVHGVQREVAVTPNFIDVGKHFGVKE